MRLFVAVELGSDIQRSLSRVVDELKRRTERLAPHARITWVKPEQLHITVRFIGHVEPVVAAQIVSALAPPLDAVACSLAIKGTGTFPPRRSPRVVWAGITSGVDDLIAVEREVGSRLRALLSQDRGPRGELLHPTSQVREEGTPGRRRGVEGEERDYHPHVTLGRVKSVAGLRPARLLEGWESTDFGAVRVEAVTLFESRSSSNGSIYVPLGRTPLARTS